MICLVSHISFMILPWCLAANLVVESMAYAILDLTIRGSTRWPEIQTSRERREISFYRRHGDAVDICRNLCKSTSFNVNFQFSMLHPIFTPVQWSWSDGVVHHFVFQLRPWWRWRSFAEHPRSRWTWVSLHSVGWSSQTHWVQGCTLVFQPWRRCKFVNESKMYIKDVCWFRLAAPLTLVRIWTACSAKCNQNQHYKC